jgi:hypothetical protein
MRGALLGVAGAIALIAASPVPGPTRINPKDLLPKTKLHSEFIVDVNKLGQVTRVRSMKSSGDATFNAQTYGNAQQAFIRKPDGSVVVGQYKMTYDFNPGTGRVHREALLYKRGGVDPNAKGLANEMEEIARRHSPEPSAPAVNPAAPVRTDNRKLPDLPQILSSPGH